MKTIEILCTRVRALFVDLLHNSTKKRKHYFDILKAFFVQHSSEYKMSDEKSFQYVKIMLPLFRAVVKFCSTYRL